MSGCGERVGIDVGMVELGMTVSVLRISASSDARGLVATTGVPIGEGAADVDTVRGSVWRVASAATSSLAVGPAGGTFMVEGASVGALAVNGP